MLEGELRNRDIKWIHKAKMTRINAFAAPALLRATPALVWRTQGVAVQMR